MVGCWWLLMAGHWKSPFLLFKSPNSEEADQTTSTGMVRARFGCLSERPGSNCHLLCTVESCGSQRFGPCDYPNYMCGNQLWVKCEIRRGESRHGPKSVQGTKSIHDSVIKTAIQPAMCQRPKSFESCTSVAGRMTRDTVCGSSSGWKQSCLKEVVFGPTLELSADTLLLRSRNLLLQRWSVLPGRLDWGWTWRSPTWP